MEVMSSKPASARKATQVDVVPWGLAALDRLTKGLNSGQLALFGAHPGVGRSALALRMVEALALERKIPVALVSLEMTTQQVLVRLACSHARIDLLQLYLGKGSGKTQEKFTQTLTELSRAPFQVFATPRMTVAELNLEAHRILVRTHNRLLIVDGLHLLAPENPLTAGDVAKWRPAIAKGVSNWPGI